MTLQSGQSLTSLAQNGRAAFTTSTTNSGIATATVSGNTITVTGHSTAGTATITVTDADGEQATISVTVKTAVSATPSTLSFATQVSANQTSTAAGGTSPYLATSDNPSVCTCSVSGTTVTVTPVGPGSTTVHVQDSLNTTTPISVSVGFTTTAAYAVTFTSPSDSAKSVTLSGGSGYTFINSNTNVASFVLVGSSGVLKPVSPGTCTITLSDSAGDQAVITVTVQTIPNTIPTWTWAQTKQSVKFFDPSNTSNSCSPQLNPTQQILRPNNVRKYTATTNGTAVIVGGREYPPKEISLTWNQMDAADYEAFRLMQFIAPLVYVDNNDQGYLGVLVIDEVQQLAGTPKKAYSVAASFLVIGPYNGQSTIINQLTVPTVSGGSFSTGGYLPASTTLYFFATVFTPFGESLPGPAVPITTVSTSNNSYIQLTWSAPISTWYRKTRLYWTPSNNSTTATFLTDVLAGQPTTFNVYAPYVGYSTLQPPTFGTAFTGYFSGAKWVQSS